MRTSRRRVGGAIALAISALGVIAAAVFGSGILALVASLGLVAFLLAVERFPRAGDR
jgi:hypothetical protein